MLDLFDMFFLEESPGLSAPAGGDRTNPANEGLSQRPAAEKGTASSTEVSVRKLWRLFADVMNMRGYVTGERNYESVMLSRL